MGNFLNRDDSTKSANFTAKNVVIKTTVADTGTIKTPVTNTKAVIDTSAVKSTAPPWVVKARIANSESWYDAILRWRGQTKHKVEFLHNKEVWWLDKSNVLLWAYYYRPTENQNTRVAVRDFPSPNNTKAYSILVHSFPTSGTSVPYNVSDKIALLLLRKLPKVQSGTTMTIAVHGSADSTGFGRNNLNLKLLKLRNRAVSRACYLAFTKWLWLVQKKQLFVKIKFVVDHKQKIQPEAAAFLFTRDPVHRSNPKIRPQLRSVLVTIRLTGNDSFVKPKEIPKKVVDGVRLHLMTIESKIGSLVERRRAHIASVLLRVKRGELKERYLNVQDVLEYDGMYTNKFQGMKLRFSVIRWMRLLGGGASTWDYVLADALTGVPPLSTIEKALDKILKEMNEAYAKAKLGPAVQEGYGSLTAVKNFIDKIGSDHVMRALLIR